MATVALGAPAFAADTISDLRIVSETGTTLIVSVAFNYDSANGDCVRMRAVANDGGVGFRHWPVRPGAGIAFMAMRSISSTAPPSSTQIDVRMERCDGTLVVSQPFTYPKTWDLATGDFIQADVIVTNEDPAKIEFDVQFDLRSSHGAPVRIFPKAITHGGVVPFSQGIASSSPLASGWGSAGVGILQATTGIYQSDAILLEMREDGGPVFHSEVVPQVKQWSYDTTDSDGDGLADDTELAFSTDPLSKDTDNDGLEDGWEMQGYRWTDGRVYPEGNLPLLGADPLHRDVFVEVDYTVAGGIDQRMHIDSINKVKDLYASVDILNPDGEKGIDVRIFHDDAIADDGTLRGVCGMRNFIGFFDDRANRIYHWAVAAPGEGGQADVVSNHMTFGTGNGNPGMDDRSKFMAFAVFTHELGHNLGLFHEGRNGTGQQNCKPNYFSLMNYAYDYSFQCSGLTLASTQIRFSDGSAPAVDLGTLDENTLPVGLEPLTTFDADFLGCNAFSVLFSPRAVDWNQNASYDPGTVSVSTSGVAPSCSDQGVANDQRDSNDYTTMEELMAQSIRNPARSGCENAGPENGWMVFDDTLAMQPVCGVGEHEHLVDHPWLRGNPVFEPTPGTVLEDPQLTYEMLPLLGPKGELLDPATIDEDEDQIADVVDNCLGTWNPEQKDENGDGIGTDCQCGDLDWDGDVDQYDVDLLTACVNDPQTCQHGTDRADMNDDGVIDQADVDDLHAHVGDPLEHPVQNLRCGQRPSGLSPVRYAPEPGSAAMWGAGLAMLLFVRTRRGRGLATSTARVTIGRRA